MTAADVLVLGGGAIGLSIAWCAARRGARVALIERGALGRQSSWSAAGILPHVSLQHARTPYRRAMAEASRLHPEHAEQLKAETGLDTGYLRCGELFVAPAAADRPWLEEELERQRELGAEITAVTPGSHGLAVGIAGAALTPQAAQLRPPWYLRALEEACRGRNVELVTGRGAARLLTEGDRVVGAETDAGERWSAGTTVIAAGAWSSALAGPSLAVRPMRGQIALLRLAGPLEPRVISVHARYLVLRPDGHVLVGSTMEDVGFDARTTSTGVHGLLDFATRLMPALANAEVVATWAGLRPCTVSGEPVVGPDPARAGLWIAAGHTRQGIHLAPHTGEEVAAGILG